MAANETCPAMVSSPPNVVNSINPPGGYTRPGSKLPSGRLRTEPGFDRRGGCAGVVHDEELLAGRASNTKPPTEKAALAVRFNVMNLRQRPGPRLAADQPLEPVGNEDEPAIG